MAVLPDPLHRLHRSVGARIRPAQCPSCRKRRALYHVRLHRNTDRAEAQPHLAPDPRTGNGRTGSLDRHDNGLGGPQRALPLARQGRQMDDKKAALKYVLIG